MKTKQIQMTVFYIIFSLVQEITYKLYEASKACYTESKLASLFRKLFPRLNEIGLIVYNHFHHRTDREVMSNIHRDSFFSMLMINGYFVRDSLLDYFTKSVINIADDIPIRVPTIQQLQSEDYEDGFPFLLRLLALPLRHSESSSSDDTVILVNRHDVDVVLKEMLKLRKKDEFLTTKA